jgi:two-component system, OmpR family, alkaline phosphatase synthesis response regulator PhoP
MNTSHPKILLVEDEEILRRMYVKQLMAEGFDVVEAANGVLGLQLVKQEKPAVMLLDVMMPGDMNGFDVLEAVKRDEEIKNIPVILLTNLNSEEQTAKSIGAAGYFVKANTSLEELVGKIKALLPKTE